MSGPSDAPAPPAPGLPARTAFASTGVARGVDPSRSSGVAPAAASPTNSAGAARGVDPDRGTGEGV